MKQPTCVGGVDVEANICASIIQVATFDLIDLITLAEVFKEPDMMREFGEKFLSNKKIIKLGYGFTHDIKVIGRSFNHCYEMDALRQSNLDLEVLTKQVIFQLFF